MERYCNIGIRAPRRINSSQRLNLTCYLPPKDCLRISDMFPTSHKSNQKSTLSAWFHFWIRNYNIFRKEAVLNSKECSKQIERRDRMHQNFGLGCSMRLLIHRVFLRHSYMLLGGFQQKSKSIGTHEAWYRFWRHSEYREPMLESLRLLR